MRGGDPSRPRQIRVPSVGKKRGNDEGSNRYHPQAKAQWSRHHRKQVRHLDDAKQVDIGDGMHRAQTHQTFRATRRSGSGHLRLS